MGLYDSIYFSCPRCGDRIEAQSKSGDCNLSSYEYDSVPRDVAEDANRHAPFTCNCGESYQFEEDEDVNRVKLKIIHL